MTRRVVLLVAQILAHHGIALTIAVGRTRRVERADLDTAGC